MLQCQTQKILNRDGFQLKDLSSANDTPLEDKVKSALIGIEDTDMERAKFKIKVTEEKIKEQVNAP